MTNFTFEKWTKVSIASHEHITLRFIDGSILARTVDSTRSVKTEWNAIGTYGKDECQGHVYTKWVCFTELSAATDLAATQMERMGYDVRSKFNEISGKINVQRSYGNVTNPDTIRFKQDQYRLPMERKGVKPVRNRNKAHKRANAQAFGAMGTVNVEKMRHAIETLRLKREGVL